jgi:uncharacterized membrane protein
MIFKEIVGSCFTTHKGKTIGILCGLSFGVLILVLGFWKGIFLSLCIGAGFWIGSFYDRKENFLSFLDKLLPDGIRSKVQ